MAAVENDDDIINLFIYHAPFGDQPSRYMLLRGSALTFARQIMENCPRSAERTLAVRALQQAVMLANASIAINEKPPQL